MSFTIRNISAGVVAIDDLGITLAIGEEYDLSQDPGFDQHESLNLRSRISASEIGVVDPLFEGGSPSPILTTSQALQTVDLSNSPNFRIFGGELDQLDDTIIAGIDALAPGQVLAYVGSPASTATWRNVPVGAQGTGGFIQLQWKFRTGTAASDPGSKNFRYNSATPASITEIYVNDTTDNGGDASTLLAALTAGDKLYIQQLDVGVNNALFTVVSVVDNTGWFTITVTVDDSGTLPSNNRVCGWILGFIADAASQNLFETIDADTGSVTALSPTASLALAGGTAVTTTIAGSPQTLTIDFTGSFSDLSGSPLTSIYVDQDQIIYVGKHGNDANDGRTIEKAVLTFGQAVTLVVAETPTVESEWAIVCLDGGQYTEDIALTTPFIILHAPNAHLDGGLSVTDDISVTFEHIHDGAGSPALGNAIEMVSGTDSSYIALKYLEIEGGANGIVNNGSGILNVEVEFFRQTDGIGVQNSATTHVDIQDWDIEGTSPIGLQSTGGTTNLRSANIDGIAATSSLGFDVNAGEVNAFCTRFECDTFYDVEAAGVLNYMGAWAAGTELNDGSADILLAEHVSDFTNPHQVTFGLLGGSPINTVSAATDQNLWETMSSDAGSVAANITTDTFTIAGGAGVSTAIAGDTLTITATGGAIVPGSPPFSIQFNDAGAFEGSSQFTFDPAGAFGSPQSGQVLILGNNPLSTMLAVGGTAQILSGDTMAPIYLELDTPGGSIDGFRIYFNRQTADINGWIGMDYDGSRPNICIVDEDDDAGYIQFITVGSPQFAGSPLIPNLAGAQFINRFGGRNDPPLGTAGATTGFEWSVNGVLAATMDTNYFEVPGGSPRPATPRLGSIHFDQGTNKLEGYEGSPAGWVNLVEVGGGGGSPTPVTSSESFTDNSIIRGNGTARVVQDSNSVAGSPIIDWTIGDDGKLTGRADVDNVGSPITSKNWAFDFQNSSNTGDGFRIHAGEALGDIVFRLDDSDGSFGGAGGTILDVEADQGHITLGKTYAQTLSDNGVVYGIDNQHSGVASDINVQVGQYRLAGIPLPIASYHLFMDQVEYPVSSDWDNNVGAPASADSNNASLTVRLFDDTVDESFGWILEVPELARNMTVRTKARAETAPGGAVNAAMVLHKRNVPDNAALGSWTQNSLTRIDLPTNELFQYDETTDTLANWGVTAGTTYQWQLSRSSASGSPNDTLVGDLAFLEICLVFD